MDPTPEPIVPAPVPPAAPPTPPSAHVEIEGQRFDIPPALAGDDARLLDQLRPFMPQLGATPRIERRTDPATGHLTVQIVKQAGHKGSATARICADLQAAPATVQTAVSAAWALYQMEQAGTLDLATRLRLVPAIDAALDAGDAEADAARRLIDTLRHAAPVPAPTVPPGF